MREELDKLLCAKYPEIFADRDKSMQETAMCWGFEHGDGWFEIINQLCANIQHHIDWSKKNHDWDIAYNEKHLDEQRTVREVVSQVVAVQIKEKFGTLRFYYDGGDEAVDGMVRMAESMSAVTCETCGSPGVQRGGGWIRTLCDTHEAEYQNRFLKKEVE